MRNCISIDIETWAYGDTPEMRRLSSQERKAMDNGYLPGSVRKVLALLRDHGVRLTMFLVGEQYDWYPELPEQILADGHELGLHAYRHYRIDDLATLRQDLEKAMPLVRKFGIKGYRAPLIHLPAGGFAVLAEFGFAFDSSVYGPFSLAGNYFGVAEIPISALRFRRDPANLTLPRHLSFRNMLREREFSFGASYFAGLFGHGLAGMIRRVNQEGSPAVVFLHNWQLFPPPTGTFPPRGYVLRHPLYWPLTRNIHDAFRKLLTEFEFDRMSTFAGTGKPEKA